MGPLFAFRQKPEDAATGERHARSGLLADFILGSQDGIVNVLAVLLGVAAAALQQYGSASTAFRVVVAGGLAATFGESISMGAVAYTSTLARRDHYLGELAREEREMLEVPEVERQEVREVFRRWDFAGKELEDAVNHICSKPKAWLEFMMAHELQLAPLEANQARKSAVLVGFAAIFGSLIPLVPFLVFPSDIVMGMIGSLIVAGITLFVIGWYKGHMTIGRPFRSGTQMLIIGIVSAIAGFLIAYIVGAAPA
jgi:VIT1/CCC1 family predicted Fe2+/Mn2+ transporter